MVQAAWAIMERDGTEALSLRKVAAAVGVRHPDTYREFSDKHAIVTEVARQGFERLNAAMVRAAATSDDPRGRLRATGQAYVGFATANPVVFQLMGASIDQRVGPIHPAVRLAAAQAKTTLGQAIETIGSEHIEGQPQAADLGTKIAVAWSMMHGIAMLAIGGQISLDDVEGKAVTQMACTVLYRGLRG